MSVCSPVLALLVLQLGLAKCFLWDVVVSKDNQLQFYNNGTLTHKEDISSATQIYAITYDAVHNRILFVDKNYGNYQITSSFDLSTRNIQRLVTRSSTYLLRMAYDPVTQLLFLKEGWGTINSFSLNPASANKADKGNFIASLDSYCYDIAVDSCGGFLYWITNNEIVRARFDGSEREVLIHDTVWYRYSLTIDQQTQIIYWTEKINNYDYQVSIKSADLNGKNRKTLYTIKNETEAGSLAVSNDFIYWNGINQTAIWQLPKKSNEAKLLSTSNNKDWDIQMIATNYKIKDQLNGNHNCEALKNLIPNESDPDLIDVALSIHDTKVSGESRCKCTQGYTGEKCDVYVCHNYCLEGNCSVSTEGQPKCSCNAGYSGERCQVNTCHGYCLNSGICTLNEDHNPVCQCTEGYDGERCAIPAVVIKCVQTVSMLKDMLNADIPPVTRSKGTQMTCAPIVV